MSCPVIIAHWFWDKNINLYTYIRPCLEYAEKYNPGQIYFISNKSVLGNDGKFFDVENVHYVELSELEDERMNNLATHYIHMSSSLQSCEYFAIMRWIPIHILMCRSNMNHAVILDSDILTFCDFSDHLSKFLECDATKGADQLCVPFFVMNRDALADYCEFILSIYRDKNKFYDMACSLWKSFQNNKHAGGICDMTTIMWWASQDRGFIIADPLIRYPDGIFDENLMANRIFNVEMVPFLYDKTKMMKKLYWINGQPYCKFIGEDAMVRLFILHLGGVAKSMTNDLLASSKESLCIK